MAKAAHPRFSLTRLVKHFSTGSQSANTATKPSSASAVHVPKAQVQAWQCERETAQTLRDTVQGYVSEMKDLGQSHALPSGCPDNEKPRSCPYDHNCSQLQHRLEEFDKHYPVEYSPALSEWPVPRDRERWTEYCTEIGGDYAKHIQAAKGMLDNAPMTAATSFAKREAQKGHTESPKLLNTSAEISFAGSDFENECTARLSELTGKLNQLNTEYNDELEKRPLSVSVAGDKEWTNKLDRWIMASSKAITEIQKLKAHGESHAGESQLSQVSYTARNQDIDARSAARDQRRVQT